MFDNYSFLLFEKLPDLDDLKYEECRRTLTRAYMYSIKKRLNLIQEDYLSIDLNSLSEEEIDQIEEEVQEGITSSDFIELYNELRRLGDTLESNAIFDINDSDDVIKASSFVAAESLSLLSTLLTRDLAISEQSDLLFSNELIYTRVEAAMLYLIAGYDANAFTEINEISNLLKEFQPINKNDNILNIEYWCLMNIISFCSNKLWKINCGK